MTVCIGKNNLKEHQGKVLIAGLVAIYLLIGFLPTLAWADESATGLSLSPQEKTHTITLHAGEWGMFNMSEGDRLFVEYRSSLS